MPLFPPDATPPFGRAEEALEHAEKSRYTGKFARHQSESTERIDLTGLQKRMENEMNS